MIGIQNDINTAITLLKTPLDLGFGQLDFDEGGPEPAAPEGVPGGGGGIETISKFIAKAETGGRYDAYSGDNGSGDPNITKMTLTQLKQKYPRTAVGAHQFKPDTAIGLAKQMGVDPNKAVFTPEFQDRLNQFHLKQMGYDKFMSGKITQQQFGTAIAQQYRALPDPRTGKTYADQYSKDNSATVTLNEFNNILKKSKQQPAQITPSPVTPLPRSRVIDEINVSGPKGGLPDVGLSGGGGRYGAYRSPTRSHAGIDIGTSGQRGWMVGFKASGTVTYAGQGGGYGNLVIIKSGNTEYYFAHLARIFVKLGPYNGEVIGEIGSTGVGRGIHLHYEVRPNGRPIDPKPYLNLLDIGRKTVAPQTAAATSETPSAQIASAKPETSQTTTQITTERKGQVIVLPMPETQVAQAPMPTRSTGRGSALTSSSSDTSELYTYIEQSQYFHLA
jgi:murein DD-endopeptidase MepM/ murein hydrolase activator NlpD